ncbi:hypothetical protein QCD60_19735 [Pokkaliibacter sp. MBI-7]|uniref:hypothetical protein n=1 Tax=Pokkaliibacter sp. MBI-7 TaxID=3040600 RepID=UPI002446E2A0|nr:hypothetical protein [Pokkaliibacter sp. MBI-7]MDH2434776.1 hypothetical protein [Pokkaliibacter sp. MBI-7]
MLEKTTGISISDNMAEAMLTRYLEQSAHTYVGSSLINIPWMLRIFQTHRGCISAGSPMKKCSKAF